VEPNPKAVATYGQLYGLYRELYFGLGERDAKPAALGRVLPELRKIAAEGRKAN
jgi:L-ribulokinase